MTKPESIGGLLGLMYSVIGDYGYGNGITESVHSKDVAQVLMWCLEYVEDLQAQIDELKAQLK